MAIISVMTTDGENLRSDNVANGTTSQVDRIEAASGHVATAALARALSDVVTPFVPVRETNNPQGRALSADPVAQFRYQDGAQVTYNIVEFGVFAGNVMTHYICDDAGGTIYPKTPSLLLDVVLHITATSGDQATFTFDADLMAPVATTGTPGLVRLATDADVGNPPAAARALTTDNVDALLAEVPAAAVTPDASTTVKGKVELATAAEVLSALQGNDPGSAIEDNVPTLQALYDRRGQLYSPPATTTIEGKVELATSTEVRAAVGTDPVASVQNNVVTLQGIFDLIKVYEDGNLPNAVPPNGTIELVYES